MGMENKNNASLIYSYTEKLVNSENKSIDVVTDKLTKVLAFSGIFLKFGADMPSEGILFSVKAVMLLCIILSIAFCASGILPRSAGVGTLKPSYLLSDGVYSLTEEQMHVLITRAQIDSIPKLRELKNHRINLLNYAIGSLVLAGILFGIGGIIEGIA